MGGRAVGCVYEGAGAPKLKSTPARASEGGRAAVIDKRKTVSEGNPIGGRQRRDVQASLVRFRTAGRGLVLREGLVGGEVAWLHPWQRLLENHRVVRR